MSKNPSNDTSKSMNNISLGSTYATEKGFDLVDKGAKKLSNIKEHFEEKKAVETANEDEQQTTPEETEQEYVSRLQTSEGSEENSDNVNDNVDNGSRLKTGVNNCQDDSSAEGVNPEKGSRLKTSVKKGVNKVFGFKDNQGKISKTVTSLSVTGKTFSKFGRSVIRSSKTLDRAAKQEESSTEFLQKSVGRKVSKATNKLTKPVRRAAKKGAKTIFKKLGSLIMKVLAKALKLLISLLASLGVVGIIILFVLLLLIFLLFIFGSSAGSEDTIPRYNDYMIATQKEYDRKVDDFVKDNPNGVVIGIRGDYGFIDWRVPLAIIQGTDAELSFDSSELLLLEQFNAAGLFETHEIVEHEITEIDDLGNEIITTKKILLIVNPGYEEYMKWLNTNFNVISSFMSYKGLGIVSKTAFTPEQQERIDSLFESELFFEQFDEILFQNFQTVKGFTEKDNDYHSPAYNENNKLHTSGYRGQCTWYSYGRALELTGIEMPTGNAQTWLSSAVAKGLPTGSRPSKNAVVVLAGTTFGHVAYVESYDGQEITISEGNWGNKCSGNTDCSMVEYAKEHALELIHKKTYSSFAEYKEASLKSGLHVIGFIYLEERKSQFED